MRYELLTISKPSVKAGLDIFWASQTSFMLQNAAKSSAMVPRMIGTMLFLGQKSTKTRFFFGQDPFEALQNSSKLFFLYTQKHSKTLKNTRKHSKTLKNTQKHSKTLKNTQKHSKTLKNKPGTTQANQTKAPF